MRISDWSSDVCSSDLRAGQHVTISVEINGVRHTRVYSLSCDPAVPNLLTLTVKRQADGVVSNWLHDQLQVGDIVTLGEADGDFVLADTDSNLLLDRKRARLNSSH